MYPFEPGVRLSVRVSFTLLIEATGYRNAEALLIRVVQLQPRDLLQHNMSLRN